MRVAKNDLRGAYKFYGLFYTEDRVISKEYILKTDASSEPVLCYDYTKAVWQELDRTRFLWLLNTGPRQGELSEMSEQDALWFLEKNHAFNGEGDDAAVEAFLATWTEKQKQRRPEWEKMKYPWPAKYVETTFYLKGKQYSITPDSIGLKTGDCWDEGFLEFLQNDIGEDLKGIGAEEIRHLGFLD